jgi:Protein of unknown function (DUF4058)
MPIHDWTRVEAGIFHDFHTVWLGTIRTVLNEGLLPPGYYALAEQHAGRFITDVLTLHVPPTLFDPPPLSPGEGGIAVLDAPPKARKKVTIGEPALERRRSLAIRHVSEHHLVALLEIVSPANKDRAEHVDEFANKAASALRSGIHLQLVDLFPPGNHDMRGMHDEIIRRLDPYESPYELPADEPLTLASYVAAPKVDVYLEHRAVGAELPDMALFLRRERYVNVPLEATYQAAYRGMPAFWREVLEQPA